MVRASVKTRLKNIKFPLFKESSGKKRTEIDPRGAVEGADPGAVRVASPLPTVFCYHFQPDRDVVPDVQERAAAECGPLDLALPTGIYASSALKGAAP